jgi:chloramphenicol-sensitive protein RarD
VTQTDLTHTRLGALCAASAYLMWGLSALYWKQLPDVPPLQLLAFRVVSSLLTLVVVIMALGQLKSLVSAARTPRIWMVYAASGVVIALNWGAFMWGSVHGHVIETGLGYLISPLVSIVLGAVFFKEKLSPCRMLAVSLMVLAVANMWARSGELLPWVFLVIGLSFGVYGLLRKLGGLNPLTGLAMETFVLTLMAAAAIPAMRVESLYLLQATSGEWMLLLLAGSVSVLPLWLYAVAAKRLSLMSLGFYQYILPTTQLLLALLYYRQEPSLNTVLSFTLIWLALFLVMGETFWRTRIGRFA